MVYVGPVSVSSEVEQKAVRASFGCSFELIIMAEKPEIQNQDVLEDVVAEAKKQAEIDTVHQDEAMKVLATYE